jgi:hypothetical protein
LSGAPYCIVPGSISHSCAVSHDAQLQLRHRPDRIVMARTSRMPCGSEGASRKVRLTTYLLASSAADIRGTSIAKTVIPSDG